MSLTSLLLLNLIPYELTQNYFTEHLGANSHKKSRYSVRKTKSYNVSIRRLFAKWKLISRLVTSCGDTELDQYWLRQWLATWRFAPSHYLYLNQCWLIAKGVLWHSPESNFTRTAIDLIRSETYVRRLHFKLLHLPAVHELIQQGCNYRNRPFSCRARTTQGKLIQHHAC